MGTTLLKLRSTGKNIKSFLFIIILLLNGWVYAVNNIKFGTKFVDNAKNAGLFTDAKFYTLIQSLEKFNKNIPVANKNSLRVVTYNVHAFKNAFMKKTGKYIYQLLKNINPDVIVLQEAINTDKTVFELSKIGYKHIVFAPIDMSKRFGNMILSKYPFKKKEVKNYKSNYKIKTNKKRSYIKVEIDLSKFGKKNLVIYGTHLAIYSQIPKHSPINKAPDELIRAYEVKEILSRVKNEDKNKNVIIAGDLNTRKNSFTLKQLVNNGFKDNFSLAKVNVPVFTNLHGGAIDFIFSKLIDLKSFNSYIYFSAASNHLPVISDIKLK